jgi:hypothetical protein
VSEARSGDGSVESSLKGGASSSDPSESVGTWGEREGDGGRGDDVGEGSWVTEVGRRGEEEARAVVWIGSCVGTG